MIPAGPGRRVPPPDRASRARLPRPAGHDPIYTRFKQRDPGREPHHGPVKIDLFPIGGRRSLQPPWKPDNTTLSAIDGHYWDWMLWLGGKALRHQDELVNDELAKMRWFLLGPLGVERTPADLQDAVALYLRARAVASERFQTSVPQGLGRPVLAALRQHRVV